MIMDGVYTSKFLDKKKKNARSTYISKLFSRVLISVILFLSSMIFINYSDKNKALFTKYAFEQNFKFNFFTEWYNKYFGDVLPVPEIPEDNLVFNENIAYKKIETYENGFVLEVNSNYLVPVLKSGIIVYVGEKENYGNTVIVQGIDGVDIWYSNINLTEYSLYDYVEEGKVLGEAKSDQIYLVFSKDGNFIGHEEYFS